MSSLTTLEKRQFEGLLGMAGGYVLGFTNNSFAQLFADEAGIDIFDNKYAYHGTSKANRMRRFWELESDPVVGKVLSTLLEIWKYENKGISDQLNANYLECSKIVSRLFGKPIIKEKTESDFLSLNFGGINVDNLQIDSSLKPILTDRIKEAKLCLQNDLSLSVIFLCGSVLEGVLLATATQNQQKFGQSICSPKDKSGKVKPFHDWTLTNLIDVACDTEILGLDVKKFSHVLKDFRNYIHPYQQMVSNFNPDKHTAKICMQVLEAAIADLSKNNQG